MLRDFPDYWMAGHYDLHRRPVKFAGLEIVTPPSGAILDTTDGLLKASLRVDDDQTAEDSLLDLHVATATRYCEDAIPGGRQFLTAVYDLPVSGWWEGPLKLPLPPLISVGSIKYYATDGTLTTLATTYYGVRIPVRMRGAITREPNQVWPALQCDRPFPVVIRFTCGYGAAASVPAPIKQAMLLTCGWLYQDREPTERETKAIDSLLRSEGYGAYP